MPWTPLKAPASRFANNRHRRSYGTGRSLSKEDAMAFIKATGLVTFGTNERDIITGRPEMDIILARR